MYVLGINSAYHESAACLVRDGEVVAAAEEERFTRRKHAKAARLDNPHELPERAIRYCLEAAGIGPGAVNRIGFSLNPKLRLRNRELADHVVEGGWGSTAGEEEFHRNLMQVPERLARLGLAAPLAWLEHHRCHAACAFLASPFNEAAVLSVDGIGETASTLFAEGKGNHLEVLGGVEYPASLGFLWEKLSTFLGFGEYDACKVMGLAAYGDAHRYRDRFDALVHLLPEGRFSIDNEVTRFRSTEQRPLEQHFGIKARQRGEPLARCHEDLAAALQEVTSRVVVHLARHVHAKTGQTHLCIAGGVGLNCVTNREVLEQTPFTRLYVAPAAHDAGTAVGAALLLWAAAGRGERRGGLEHAYLGPRFTPEEVERELVRRGLPYRRVERLHDEVAERLCRREVVGWFQGAMEFGPRALGNRSLLADPRDPLMRDRLNRKVKHREPFRPFAPSVMAEHAAEWFEVPEGCPAAEYMLLAVPARPEGRGRIPAVVHVDGSSRIQLVRKEQNPGYHAVLAAFHDRTGVPLLLNTSFNDDEPIVCSPADAIETFLKTRIDCLAMEGFLVERPGP